MNLGKIVFGACMGIGAVVCAPVAIGALAVGATTAGAFGVGAALTTAAVDLSCVGAGTAAAVGAGTALFQEVHESAVKDETRKETTIENSAQFAKKVTKMEHDTEDKINSAKKAYTEEVKAKDDIIKSQDDIIHDLSSE